MGSATPPKSLRRLVRVVAVNDAGAVGHVAQPSGSVLPGAGTRGPIDSKQGYRTLLRLAANKSAMSAQTPISLHVVFYW